MPAYWLVSPGAQGAAAAAAAAATSQPATLTVGGRSHSHSTASESESATTRSAAPATGTSSNNSSSNATATRASNRSPYKVPTEKVPEPVVGGTNLNKFCESARYGHYLLQYLQNHSAVYFSILFAQFLKQPIINTLLVNNWR